jgi:AcrR family transcriptional regulator
MVKAVPVNEKDPTDGLGRTARKRRAILQMAETLFLDRGFDGTSVD